MAHKTFISYKYSEKYPCSEDAARNLRDEIIKALGNGASYYQGETADSPDMTDLKTDTIKKNLTDMMYGTSVTIVVISPNMKSSEWIDWEIEYCLKNITRKDRTSQTNGVVGVIMKVNGGYDWLINHYTNCHGSPCINYKEDKLYPIIYKNQFNSNPPIQHCPLCKTFDFMNGSYITFVEEETFLQDPQKYIDNAYDKSENNASGYDLTKQR
jgi:hypothetical protein